MQIGSALKVFCGAIIIALVISWPTLAWLPRPDTMYFMVFFRTDSATIDEPSLEVLKRSIIPELNGRYDGRIVLTGYCDTQEKDVSLARAEAVKAKLMELGISGSRISVQSRGTNGLLVPTPQGVSEIQNRRVEAYVERLCGKSCSPEASQDSGSSRD